MEKPVLAHWRRLPTQGRKKKLNPFLVEDTAPRCILISIHQRPLARLPPPLLLQCQHRKRAPPPLPRTQSDRARGRCRRRHRLEPFSNRLIKAASKPAFEWSPPRASGSFLPNTLTIEQNLPASSSWHPPVSEPSELTVVAASLSVWAA